MTTDVDVVVVGAGPAGSALASRLAAGGRAVLLVDAGSFDTPRVGESFAPGVQPLLRDLGAWPAFMSTTPLESWGTKSRWTGDAVDAHSHLFSALCNGWHVDRRAVDEALARHAAARGATLALATPIGAVAYDEHRRRWSVRSEDGLEVSAGVLVDASGRHGRIARRLGARRHVFDHLVGVGRIWQGAGDGGERFVGVEAAPEGWWYSAPVPGGAVITLLMTDADACRSEGLTDERAWRRALDATVLTSARIGGRWAVGRVRSHASFSARLLRSDRRPWLAVGDAALAVDPLSGSGVVRALRMAADAAPVVDALIDGAGHDVVEPYEWARHAECHDHLFERLAYYDASPLFDTPFWSRRRTVAARFQFVPGTN